MCNVCMEDVHNVAVMLSDIATDMLDLNTKEDGELYDRLCDLLEDFCKVKDYGNYN